MGLVPYSPLGNGFLTRAIRTLDDLTPASGDLHDEANMVTLDR